MSNGVTKVRLSVLFYCPLGIRDPGVDVDYTVLRRSRSWDPDPTGSGRTTCTVTKIRVTRHFWKPKTPEISHGSERDV